MSASSSASASVKRTDTSRSASLYLGQFSVEPLQRSIKGLTFLHQGEGAVFELGGPFSQAFDVGRHSLQLPRGRDGPAVQPGINLGHPVFSRLEFPLGRVLTRRHLSELGRNLGTVLLFLAHKPLQLDELGPFGKVRLLVLLLVNVAVQVLQGQQRVQVGGAQGPYPRFWPLPEPRCPGPKP